MPVKKFRSKKNKLSKKSLRKSRKSTRVKKSRHLRKLIRVSNHKRSKQLKRHMKGGSHEPLYRPVYEQTFVKRDSGLAPNDTGYITIANPQSGNTDSGIFMNTDPYYNTINESQVESKVIPPTNVPPPVPNTLRPKQKTRFSKDMEFWAANASKQLSREKLNNAIQTLDRKLDIQKNNVNRMERKLESTNKSFKNTKPKKPCSEQKFAFKRGRRKCEEKEKYNKAKAEHDKLKKETKFWEKHIKDLKTAIPAPRKKPPSPPPPLRVSSLPPTTLQFIPPPPPGFRNNSDGDLLPKIQRHPPPPRPQPKTYQQQLHDHNHKRKNPNRNEFREKFSSFGSLNPVQNPTPNQQKKNNKARKVIANRRQRRINKSHDLYGNN